MPPTARPPLTTAHKRQTPDKPPTSHAPGLTVIAAALLAILFPTNASAEPPSPRDLLNDLASPDYHTRHAATQQLTIDETISLQTVKDLFANATNPEQRHRLLPIAEHHLLREKLQQFRTTNTAGALGITHRPLGRNHFPTLDRAAIMVINTLPGFPAHGVLQPGDFILSIADDPIPPTFTAEQVSHTFVQTIRKLPAGSTTQLTILRNDQKSTVTIRLTHLDALQKMYTRNQGTLTADYQAIVNTLLKQLQHNAPNPTRITPSSPTRHTNP